MSAPRMFYFGPWGKAGHYFFDERGYSVREDEILGFPFGHRASKVGVDGQLQSGCREWRGHWIHTGDPENQGEALLHHISGWTVLSFWDRSVDTRHASNSNYFAEGRFTFEQMVAMASTRFAARWSRMRFPVRLLEEREHPDRVG